MSNYYVDSFAYDFDMFAPQPKQKSNVVEIQRKKSTPSDNRSSRSPRRSASRKAPLVMMLILVLGLIAGNIYLRVQVTEVTSQINSYSQKLERAISENTSLEMEMENRVSLKNLEQSAQEMGMQKAERYQIRYIDVLDGDKTEVFKDGVLVTANAEE